MTLTYGSECANAIAALIVSMPVHLSAPDPSSFEDSDFPYVVLSVPDGVRSTDRLAGRPDQAAVYFLARVVAITDDQSRWAQAKVADALAGARPVIAGRGVNVVKNIATSTAVVTDGAAGDNTIFTATSNWSLVTLAA